MSSEDYGRLSVTKANGNGATTSAELQDYDVLDDSTYSEDEIRTLLADISEGDESSEEVDMIIDYLIEQYGTPLNVSEQQLADLLDQDDDDDIDRDDMALLQDKAEPLDADAVENLGQDNPNNANDGFLDYKELTTIFAEYNIAAEMIPGLANYMLENLGENGKISVEIFMEEVNKFARQKGVSDGDNSTVSQSEMKHFSDNAADTYQT